MEAITVASVNANKLTHLKKHSCVQDIQLAYTMHHAFLKMLAKFKYKRIRQTQHGSSEFTNQLSFFLFTHMQLYKCFFFYFGTLTHSPTSKIMLHYGTCNYGKSNANLDVTLISTLLLRV